MDRNRYRFTSIVVDREGDLWIGTKRGLCRFLYDTEKFERHIQDGSGELNSISSLYVDLNGGLFVGTEHGLFLFNKEDQSF